MTNVNLDIDTEALSQEVDKIRNKRERLNEIYVQLKNNNEVLKDSWKSQTSEVVFENFEEFYKGYQEQLQNLKDDIDFLDAVIEKYKEFDEKNSKETDENLAI